MNTKLRSGSYICTIPNDTAGNQRIANLRAENKVVNAQERAKAGADKDYRPKLAKIAIFGRLGKDNPNADFYKQPKRSKSMWKNWSNPYQYIYKKHAATFDVYLQRIQ